jgi:hypothetical protein
MSALERTMRPGTVARQGSVLHWHTVPATSGAGHKVPRRTMTVDSGTAESDDVADGTPGVIKSVGQSPNGGLWYTLRVSVMLVVNHLHSGSNVLDPSAK